jgi:hypothetical protein
MHLLKGLLPSPFPLKGLEAAMMFLHDRLLRIQHETIDSCHRRLPFVCSRRTVTESLSTQQLYEWVDDVID